MQCPLCHQSLQDRQSCLVCPQGHGVLVTGKYLHDVRSAPLNVNEANAAGSNTVQVITCPHDAFPMQKVDYNGTGIIIDTCPRCPYRWLDSGEIKKIQDFKPDHTPDELLQILALEEKIGKKTADPYKGDEMPLVYNLGRGVSAGNNQRTAGVLLAGGLYVIFVGLWKSKVLRVLIPLVLLGAAFGFWLVIRSAS